MEIGGFQRVSLMDYPGRMSALVFLAGCNMRCPYCHNPQLVLGNRKDRVKYSEEEVLAKLRESKEFIDAVQISGGEPTLNKDLPAFIRRCKRMGLSVKLDTNGSNPEMVERLISERSVDYVAVDVKSVPTEEKYSRAIGVGAGPMLPSINRTIDLLLHSKVDYEFRTTVVPGLVSLGDIMDIAMRIRGARAYYLQQFRPARTLDPAYAKVQPYWTEVLNELRDKIVRQNLVKRCEVRV